MQDIEVDGHRVEAGTMVMVGIYALHRDPALWDDPGESIGAGPLLLPRSRSHNRYDRLPPEAYPRAELNRGQTRLVRYAALRTFPNLQSCFGGPIIYSTSELQQGGKPETFTLTSHFYGSLVNL